MSKKLVALYYYRNLSKELNVEIVGSYNPLKVGCNEYEFYDGMHPKDSCMDKVVSNLG